MKVPKDEINLYHFYNEIADNVEVFQSDNEYYSSINSENFDWPKYVYNINRKQSLNDVMGLVDRVTKNELPPFLITKDDDWDFNIQEFFESKGLRKIDVWPILTLNQREELIIDKVEGLSLNYVEPNSEFEAWFDIANKVLMPRKKLSKNIFKNKIGNENFKFLIGFYKNLPVAISLLYQKDGVAGIYWVATLDTARNKGIARQMTKTLINKAYMCGCETITLQSSRMSHNGYLKMGFKETGRLFVYWMI
jgi:ribosomal protein S18 acetylase RimI-like enzyme